MFKLRPVTQADFDFLWALHRAAMKHYVEATWGWDEAWQATHFRNRFDPAANQMIVIAGEAVGVVSIEDGDDALFLRHIAILPAHQRKGIGTAVIQSVSTRTAAGNRPVRLRVLKCNPARRLYERLGFVVGEETPTHFVMSTVELDGRVRGAIQAVPHFRMG